MNQTSCESNGDASSHGDDNVESKGDGVINFFVKEPVTASPRAYGCHHAGSFKSRSEMAENAVAAKLFEIMESKQSNLCLSADVENSVDLLELVNLVGMCVAEISC